MPNDNNSAQLRIGVIGAGPIGLVLSVFLIEAGTRVIHCDIVPARMNEIKRNGITLTGTMEKHVDVGDVCYSVKELEEFDLDIAIVSVKTPVLPIVAQALAGFRSEKMSIICAQNGIDNEIEVARVMGEERVLRMVVNFAGAMATESSVQVNFFNPPNYLAGISKAADPIARQVADLLNQSGLDTTVPENIQEYVWEKAILNAALSAVCAITGKTMKDVMDFPATLEIVGAILDEGVCVAEKEGIIFDEGFRAAAIRYLQNAGHHRPSMAVDLSNGRPTEIDRLNGRIAFYGQKHSLPTPLNQAVTALVHLLEHSSD